jgi:hypothetical protein
MLQYFVGDIGVPQPSSRRRMQMVTNYNLPNPDFYANEFILNGNNFINITILTAGQQFTTVKVVVETDATINTGASFIEFIGDNIFQIGNGIYKEGEFTWDGYSVTINNNPSGFTGFVVALASSTPRSSPGTFFILTNGAQITKFDAVASNAMQLADSNSPAQLFPTPVFHIGDSLSPTFEASPTTILGENFISVTVKTPFHTRFTTLKLAVETDALVDTTKSSIQFISNNIYGLGNGIYREGETNWIFTIIISINR